MSEDDTPNDPNGEEPNVDIETLPDDGGVDIFAGERVSDKEYSTLEDKREESGEDEN